MENLFNKRVDQFHQESLRYEKRARLVSTIRVLAFVTFLGLWIFFISEEYFLWFLISLILFPFAFGLLVNRHKKIKYRKKFLQHLALINKEEINRLHYKPQHFYDGTRYQDEEHPYSGDLDIYGYKNIYHFLNRSATPAGEEALATWLAAPAPKEEVKARQEAVKELKDELNWRQEIQASELEIEKEHHLELFFKWLKASEKMPNLLIAYGMAAITLVALIFWILNVVSFYIPVILALINSFILSRYSKKIKDLSEMTSQGLSVLKKYRHIIHLIENKKFNAPYLKDTQQVFKSDSYKASSSLKRLERILEFLDARSNMFYHVLNIIVLLDLHLILQSDKWKGANRKYVIQWFDAIGKVEAICSFSGYAFANPELIFPTISDEEYEFQTTELGHPLIPPHERVSNDFDLAGEGAVVIITGSNMSGKSTFLRTVGINAILAYAGSPVCAKTFLISEFDIFTSMRTKDNLEAHVSSFYAELKRIRQLLQKLKTNTKPVLYALDEVLKGTNSHDRHAGAEALVRQLNKLNCMGMISTHDLELGAIASEDEHIKNMSFNSDIVDDEILFDYKIHEGICRSFNASKLMEKMGIEINKA
ncbi:MAG: MutS-related protein [Candidatus Cyclobacteriaceae bacterium M2_1C_046]